MGWKFYWRYVGIFLVGYFFITEIFVPLLQLIILDLSRVSSLYFLPVLCVPAFFAGSLFAKDKRRLPEKFEKRYFAISCVAIPAIITSINSLRIHFLMTSEEKAEMKVDLPSPAEIDWFTSTGLFTAAVVSIMFLFAFCIEYILKRWLFKLGAVMYLSKSSDAVNN